MPHPFSALRQLPNFDLWESEFPIAIFDHVGKLAVSAGKEGPSERQRQTFDSFVESQERLKPKVYQAILDHYLGIVTDYRSQLSPESLHRAPNVQNVEEVKTLLEPPYVIFLGDVSANEIGLLCECTWEPEHGLGVRIIDGEVAEVGFQDICL